MYGIKAMKLCLFNHNKNKKPNRVFWWFKPICNLNCNHCNIGKNTDLKNFHPTLSLEKKIKIIDKIYEWIGKPYSLSFIVGEPLLHKDMLQLLKYANNKGITTSIVSNATLINTKNMAKQIINSDLDYLSLSLDSFAAKIHDETRGQEGVRDRVFKAISLLKTARTDLNKNKPKIYINSIMMSNNLKELIKLIKWSKQNKIDGITFQPIANPDLFGGSGKLGERWFETSPLWPNQKEVIGFIEEIEKMQKKGYPIKNSTSDMKKFKRYFKNPILFGIKEDNSGEYTSITITDDGHIKMCPAETQTLGDVLNEDLEQMWNSHKAHKARIHIKNCKSQCKILANNKNDFYFTAD